MNNSSTRPATPFRQLPRAAISDAQAACRVCLRAALTQAPV
ncbi:MAG: hypothetical protein WCF44_17625 [Candidatus Methylophosphatis roskildensis]